MPLTNHRASQVVHVTKDSTATILRVTFKDDNGAVINLSGAAGPLYFHASTLDGTAITTNGVAAFTGTGTDGRVQFTLTANEVGTLRSMRAEFEVQNYSGGNLISEMFILRVIERAKVV